MLVSYQPLIAEKPMPELSIMPSTGVFIKFLMHVMTQLYRMLPPRDRLPPPPPPPPRGALMVMGLAENEQAYKMLVLYAR